MGRGYSSFHRKQPLDQGKCQQAARSTRFDPGRGERETRTRAEGKAELQRRQELLKSFARKDKVTDGRYIGYVRHLDTLRGEIVVSLMPSGKEMRWSPDFISKIP